MLNGNEIILNESLRASAKQLHEHYRTKYPSIGEWELLSSFLISSNISAAGYFMIIKRLHESGLSIEELTELEHIHWSRFHYLNNKTHRCLIAFDNLFLEYQMKDRENVELALSYTVKLIHSS